MSNDKLTLHGGRSTGEVDSNSPSSPSSFALTKLQNQRSVLRRSFAQKSFDFSSFWSWNEIVDFFAQNPSRAHGVNKCALNSKTSSLRFAESSTRFHLPAMLRGKQGGRGVVYIFELFALDVDGTRMLLKTAKHRVKNKDLAVTLGDSMIRNFTFNGKRAAICAIKDQVGSLIGEVHVEAHKNT